METRSCSRCTSSPSARSRVMTPSSWPVITCSNWLDSRSKASPRSGSATRSMIGRPSSTSSTTSRRLAASASANATSAASPSAGRVRVSEQDRQSRPAAADRHQPVAAGDVQVGAHLPVRVPATVTPCGPSDGELAARPGRTRSRGRSSGTASSRRPAAGRSSGRRSRARGSPGVRGGHVRRRRRLTVGPCTTLWRRRGHRRQLPGGDTGQTSPSGRPAPPEFHTGPGG